MKKLLLLGTVLAASITASFGQASYGEQIGATYYDLPSNISGFNRAVYNEDDGSVSATWIQSITPAAQPVTFDRGFGYNHYRPGTGWLYGSTGDCQQNNGCSQPGLSNYSGWPEMINFPKETIVGGDGNEYEVTKEVIIAHSGGLKTSHRFQRGDGVWAGAPDKIVVDQGFCDDNTEGVWPRAIRSGDMIHLMALNYDGPDNEHTCPPYSDVIWPFLYYRSSDQGNSWDIQNMVLPGMETTDMFSRGRGDEYQIAVNGNTVAIVAGGGEEPWTLWKSTDAGLNWEYKVIRPFDTRVVEYDIDATTYGKETPDGSHAVVVDDDGNVHCFVGVQVLAIQKSDFTYNNTWYPNLSSGLWYWNDKGTMCEPFKIADVVDYYDASGNKHSTPIYSDNPSWQPSDYMAVDVANYFASRTTMASAATDADGNIYVVYAGDVEGTSTVSGDPTDPEAQPFKDLYLVWSNDNGTSWSYEINIAGEIAGADDGSFGTGIEEDIFPSVPHEIGSDNMLHIMWNMDYKPGSDVRDDATTDFSQQYETYYGIDVTQLTMNKKSTITAVTSNTVTGDLMDTAMFSGDTLKLVLDQGAYSTLTPDVPFYGEDTCTECGPLVQLDTITCGDSASCSVIDTNAYLRYDLIHWDTTAGVVDTIFLVDSVYMDTFSVNTSINFNDDGDSLYCISADSAGLYTVTYVFGNACPDPTDEFALATNGAPLEAIIKDTTVSICSGDSVQLVVTGNGGSGTYTYSWDNGAGSTSKVKVAPTTTTVYHATVNGGATDSIKVIVNAAPSVAAGSDGSIDNSSINDTDPCGAFGVALIGDASNATSGVSYKWTPTNGMTADEATDPSGFSVDPRQTTTYTLTATDNVTGCVAMDQVTVTVTEPTSPCNEGVGISEELSFEYSVYPNPATDIVNVELEGAALQAVTIYNNLGEVVSKVKLNNATQYTLNTSAYNAGVYYIFIETDNGDTTTKFNVVD